MTSNVVEAMMTDDVVISACAALLSAFAAILSALAAVIGLGFIGWQIRQARKTSDFTTLQAFLKDAKDCENALMSDNLGDGRKAFIELMNFLEIYAVALNKGLVPKVSRDVIRLKLCDSLAVIQNAPKWHVVLEEAISSPETFEELQKFMTKNKCRIVALQKAQAALDAQKVDLPR
ncbi:hypothetical protein [Loktanella sp. M215]|uniref:hypothetical protein n=1 Tax=Loktanella sp. M215 TaxID=2675431 RepID=UPI001F26FE00|nr:hypothetical protein [Loktanella sp. M215]MCF7698240.1 hypothetical protein [Loktanella sp. M215]